MSEYINHYLSFHHKSRYLDLYGSIRNKLFHANWIGINTHFYTYFFYKYKKLQTVDTLKQDYAIDREQWDLLLTQIHQMYDHTKQLKQLGFEFEQVIQIICSYLHRGSYIHLSVLNSYLNHPIFGETIEHNIKQIKIDEYRPKCTPNQFPSIISELTFILQCDFCAYLEQ